MLLAIIRTLLAGAAFALLMMAPTAAQAQTSSGTAPVVQRVSAELSDMEWFAFWFPDSLKQDLEMKKWLMLPALLLTFPLLGGLWVPFAMTGTPPSKDWALPILVWTGVLWAGLALSVLTCWTIVLWLVPFALSVVAWWVGVHVTFANLNRFDVRLGG